MSRKSENSFYSPELMLVMSTIQVIKTLLCNLKLICTWYWPCLFDDCRLWQQFWHWWHRPIRYFSLLSDPWMQEACWLRIKLPINHINRKYFLFLFNLSSDNFFISLWVFTVLKRHSRYKFLYRVFTQVSFGFVTGQGEVWWCGAGSSQQLANMSKPVKRT